ncbi:MAG: hypothetical protein KKH94_12440 [Candidatus Omnitrophica bacterium]|nr:hypothetical protein [Candidatus Omnitrophota bacterium]
MAIKKVLCLLPVLLLLFSSITIIYAKDEEAMKEHKNKYTYKHGKPIPHEEIIQFLRENIAEESDNENNAFRFAEEGSEHERLLTLEKVEPRVTVKDDGYYVTASFIDRESAEVLEFEFGMQTAESEELDVFSVELIMVDGKRPSSNM